MFCLYREIKKHLKCMHIFEVFQLAKLEEIQIPSKKVKFEILLTQPHTLDSIPNEPGKPDKHDRLSWPYDPNGSDRPDNTNGSIKPNNPNGSDGLNDLDGSGDRMTHTGQAGLTTQTARSSPITHTIRVGPMIKMCQAGPTTQTDQAGPTT